ncbi:MAG: type II secretion system F family protein [Deltaproteobacteria bacterium]|nr:type II secretion system F family protein [Deltaproteobacteria bacterium]
MELSTVLIFLVLLVVVIAIAVIVVTVGSGNKTGFREQLAVSDSLRAMVAAQRERAAQGSTGMSNREKKGRNLALAAAAESEIKGERSSSASKITRMDLARRLHYGKWKLTPVQFRAIQVCLALGLFVPTWFISGRMVQLLALALGPTFLSWLLERSMMKRFKAFDVDYPVLLLQYVSLLKTGMSTITGLEAASKGLDEDSLVRAEVALLIERLRLGLTEEQAINAFGEDIAHPELELFVQSLLLSKRVGGTLSTTLERLAKQVRKRQQFREQAIAAVGMERGSLWAIACIMTGLMLYITYFQPGLVLPALTHPLGKSMFQFGFVTIIIGFYWSRRVTNIKV